MKEAICSVNMRDENLQNKFLMYFQLESGIQLIIAIIGRINSNQIVFAEGTGWDCISLRFQVKWPLHLLFTEEVLYKYNLIFRLLLKVRRAQCNLLEVWKRQMEDKKIV